MNITAPAVIRQRCCWCVVKHVTDGLGPILPGELVSDGLCAIAAKAWNDAIDEIEAAK